MCRAVSLEEYRSPQTRREVCLCRGFREATWECARYWLENRMLSLFVGGKVQDGLQRDPPQPMEDTYVAFFECDFTVRQQSLAQVPLLGDDVVLSKYSDQLIIVARVVCPDMGVNAEGRKRRVLSYPPPLIAYVFNPLSKFRDLRLSEDARLAALRHHQLYYTATYYDACDIYATRYEHPTHFLDPKRYKHMVHDDGTIVEFRPVPAARRMLCKPTGLPKTHLQVVQSKEDADYFDGLNYYKKRVPAAH
jgi:hypothetical protein